MSDLWDYDDDDDQGNGDSWAASSPGNAVIEVDCSRKRKGGRKHAKASSKRQAAPPAVTQDLRPVPMPTSILLDGSDDDDDLVLLPSPEPTAACGGTSNTSGAKGFGRNLEPTRPVTTNLTVATQESLAIAQKLLQELKQVTEREHQVEDDAELSPIPSVSALSHLGLSRLASRRPMANDTAGATGTGGIEPDSDNGVVPAANVLLTSVSAAAHNGSNKEPAAVGPDDGGLNSAGGARLQLKLVWGRDKDDSIKMRVMKTDTFSKMIEKFKAYAAERSLCPDPNKIKFLFDGDDLAKMPGETPESMDMEDDMMIDVKLR